MPYVIIRNHQYERLPFKRLRSDRDLRPKTTFPNVLGRHIRERESKERRNGEDLTEKTLRGRRETEGGKRLSSKRGRGGGFVCASDRLPCGEGEGETVQIQHLRDDTAIGYSRQCVVSVDTRIRATGGVVV